MKKTLIALAALSASAAALAQSSVSFYGILDASVAYVDNANAAKKSVTLLNDGALLSSRWGLRGGEDLGGGLKARFTLEGDVNTGTGAHNAAGLFRRAAWVALASDSWGELRLGRTMSTIISEYHQGFASPSNSLAVTTAIGTGVSDDYFVANMISYYSPVISGVQGVVQYAPGEEAGDSKVRSRIYGTLKYNTKEFGVSASFADIKGTTGDNSRAWYHLNGRYNMGDWKFTLGYYDINHGSDATTTAPDNSGYMASAAYQLNAKTSVTGAWIKSDKDASLLSLQTRYALSKRTSVYALLNRADNGKEGVKISPIFQDISSGAAGTKQTALALGVIHSF